jgi:hypothetical protein
MSMHSLGTQGSASEPGTDDLLEQLDQFSSRGISRCRKDLTPAAVRARGKSSLSRTAYPRGLRLDSRFTPRDALLELR